MLLTSRDFRNQGAQAARQTPATLYSSPGDLLSAGFEAQRLTGSTGRKDANTLASREIYDWYEGRTGQPATKRAQELALEISRKSNLGRDGVPMAGVPRTQVSLDDPRVARQLLAEYIEQNPDAADAAPDLPEERAPEIAAEAEAQFEYLMERSGTGGAAAGFAGQFLAGMVAPESLATMFVAPARVGAVGFKAVGRVAAAEGAIGAASEAAVQPFVQEWRAEAGLESGFWNAVYDVALVGGASAALGGLVRSVVEVRNAVRAGKDTPDSAARRLFDNLTPQARARLDGAWSDVDAVAGVVTQQFENNPRFRDQLTPQERGAIERLLVDRKTMRALGVETPAQAVAVRAAVNNAAESLDLGLPPEEPVVNPLPPRLTPDEAADTLPEELFPEGVLEDEALAERVADALRRGADQSKDLEPEPRATPDAEPTLPKGLDGAKPRFGFGQDNFRVEFDSDIDRALYITSQKKKSRADEQYRQFLRENGFTDAQIDAQGKTVRARVKQLAGDARGQDSDLLAVPPVPKVEAQPERPPKGSPDEAAGRSADLPAPMAREAATAEAEVKAIEGKSDGALADEAEGVLARRVVEESEASPADLAPPTRTLKAESTPKPETEGPMDGPPPADPAGTRLSEAATRLGEAREFLTPDVYARLERRLVEAGAQRSQIRKYQAAREVEYKLEDSGVSLLSLGKKMSDSIIKETPPTAAHKRAAKKLYGGKVVWAGEGPDGTTPAILMGYDSHSRPVFRAAVGGRLLAGVASDVKPTAHATEVQVAILKYQAYRARKQEEAAEAASSPFATGQRVVALGATTPELRGVLEQWSDMLGMGAHKFALVMGHIDGSSYRGRYRRLEGLGLTVESEGAASSLVGATEHVIYIKPGMGRIMTLESLAHELGHRVQKAVLDAAPADQKAPIEAAYAAWRSKQMGLSIGEMFDNLRAAQTAKFSRRANRGSLTQSVGILSPRDRQYFLGFSEWFADQVARWATTEETPRTVLDQFFSRLARLLRRLYEDLGRMTSRPTPEVKTWLEGIKAGSELEVDLASSVLRLPDPPATAQDALDVSRQLREMADSTVRCRNGS